MSATAPITDELDKGAEATAPTAEELQAVAWRFQVVTHELRIRALLALAEHPRLSPKQLGVMFATPVENISYHVRTLRDAGLIKQVDTRPVRGTIERFYQLESPARDLLPFIANLIELVRSDRRRPRARRKKRG